MDGQEDANVVDNMLSLSQGHCQGLGDDDEHANATQYDHEPIEDNMEVVGPCETHTDSATHIHNDNVDLNVVESGHAPRSNNEQLTLPNQVSQLEWLV